MRIRILGVVAVLAGLVAAGATPVWGITVPSAGAPTSGSTTGRPTGTRTAIHPCPSWWRVAAARGSWRAGTALCRTVTPSVHARLVPHITRRVLVRSKPDASIRL